MKQIIGVLLIPIALTASAQTVTRKAIFQKGQHFLKTAVNQSEMSMTMMGQTRKVTFGIQANTLISVDEVRDTAYAIHHMMTHMVYDLDALGNVQHLDSDSAADRNSTMGEALFKNVGKTKNVLVNRMGDIILSEDTIAVTEEVTAATGSLPDVANALKRPGRCYELIGPLPKKPLKPGDQWVDSIDAGASKEIDTFTVTAIGPEEVVISQRGSTSSVNEINNNGVKTVITSEGYVVGSFTTDRETGVIKSASTTTTATGSIEVMSQLIPMEMKIVNNFTIQPVKG